MTEAINYIPNRVRNAAVGGHVCGAADIIDDALGLEQSSINEDVAPMPYNDGNPNGMGRIILKKTDNFKNVVEAQSGNTIFVIKYDFTLTGSVNVPANCVLEFDGGSLNNGTIYLSNGCTINGNGSTCIGLHIYAIGTDQSNINNITVRNLTIDNNNIPSYNLLRFYYCNNILLDNVSLLNYMKSDEAQDDSPGIVWSEKGSVAFNNYCSNFTILNTKILDCSYEAFSIINSSKIVVDNMTVDDINATSSEWSSLNIMRCTYVKVVNSYFSHRLNNNGSGSTLNFCSSHSILDNCHVIGGNGIDIGDETAQDEQYVGTVFNVEDVTIQNSYFNTTKGCIHTTSSKGYTKDVRVINCKIIARFTKNSYKARAFQLTNCINFLADNCDISADELLQYYATFTDNVQDINGLGNYHINNCKFEFYREAYEGIFHSSTGGAFTDIYLNNCIITDTFAAYISLVQGGTSYNSFNILNNTFNVNNIKIVLGEEIEKTILKNNIFNYASFPAGTSGINNSFLVSNSLGEFVMEGNICNNMIIRIGSNGNHACNKFKDIKNNIFNTVQIYIPDVTDFSNLFLHENIGIDGEANKITIFGQPDTFPDNSNNIYLNHRIRWNLYSMGTPTELALKQRMAIYNPVTYQYDEVRSGTFANRPQYAKEGERYFCTDKQSPEQAAIDPTVFGMDIICKGRNVWVDSLGRTIS